MRKGIEDSEYFGFQEKTKSIYNLLRVGIKKCENDLKISRMLFSY